MGDFDSYKDLVSPERIKADSIRRRNHDLISKEKENKIAKKLLIDSRLRLSFVVLFTLVLLIYIYLHF